MTAEENPKPFLNYEDNNNNEENNTKAPLWSQWLLYLHRKDSLDVDEERTVNKKVKCNQKEIQ